MTWILIDFSETKKGSDTPWIIRTKRTRDGHAQRTRGRDVHKMTSLISHPDMKYKQLMALGMSNFPQACT